jgi:hypothetical protein
LRSLGLNSFEGDPPPADPAYRHPSALLQPKRNVSAGIQYDFNLANGGVISPRLDWFYQSKRTNGPITLEQRCPEWCIPEYDYANARYQHGRSAYVPAKRCSECAADVESVAAEEPLSSGRHTLL